MRNWHRGVEAMGRSPMVMLNARAGWRCKVPSPASIFLCSCTPRTEKSTKLHALIASTVA